MSRSSRTLRPGGLRVAPDVGAEGDDGVRWPGPGGRSAEACRGLPRAMSHEMRDGYSI